MKRAGCLRGRQDASTCVAHVTSTGQDVHQHACACGACVRACVRACVQSLLIGGDNCALSTLSTTPCQRRGQPLATGLITRIERPAGRATP
jgi:hypothetical protein